MCPLLLLLHVTVLTACPRLVAADTTWHLNVQAYSFHEHTTQDYLWNTTPGASLIRRQDNWLLGEGIFRNSIGRWAGYGYGGWQYPVAQFANARHASAASPA